MRLTIERTHSEDTLDDPVSALRERRIEALDLLLAAYGREIQGVAYLILDDRAAAEDVLMDTLIAAWEQFPKLRDGAALRPWLLRIAANRSISAVRRGRRVRALTAADDRPGLGHTEADMVTHLTLLAVVADLPPRTRAAVVLHYYAGMTVEEAARALGRSPNTVKRQIRDALEAMRGRLAPPREASRVDA